jgi:hypothetical protein
MNSKQIEKAIGYRASLSGYADYIKPAIFETKDGRRIGAVRHSGNDFSREGPSHYVVEQNGERLWHYSETDGVGHETRTIAESEIVRVVSEGDVVRLVPA